MLKRLSEHLDWIQAVAARVSLLVWLALKARNQANAIIRMHLGPTTDVEKNGEADFAREMASSCDTFVDVGANIGQWTSMFLRYAQNSARGLLYEPGPSAYSRLKNAFSANRNLELVNAGVGQRNELRDFYDEQEGIGDTSSFTPGYSFSRPTTVRRVQVVTLDEEIARRGWDRVDFLKIDAESFDYFVLAGARTLLAAARIRTLQFEYNLGWPLAGTTLAAALGLLRECGYQHFLLKKDGLFNFDYGKYGEFCNYANFVAVPGREVGRVASLIRGNA
jgi:FkbM family methyltransferase